MSSTFRRAWTVRVLGFLGKAAGPLSRFPTFKDKFSRLMARMHTTTYQRSGGKLGKSLGAPALLLSVRGRRSGTLHTTPLYYVRDANRFVVAGSNAGDARAPQWYLNLMSAQSAQIQVNEEVIMVIPRLAESDDRARLWQCLAAIWPSFKDYQRHTERQIPVVVLEPQPL
jgi:deazaflavin-dependent oxidoreductase (nitroreductase family)